MDSKYDGRSAAPFPAIASRRDEPGKRCVGWSADRLQQRRQQVHVPRRGLDDDAGVRRFTNACADLAHDQRHLQHRLVGEHAVRQLAMVAETFAVIGRDDGKRGARLRGQPIEEHAKRGVGERDFPEVGIRRKARLPLAGRIVGDVRIVDVDPDEPLAGLPADPLEGGGDDGVGATLTVVFIVGALARRSRLGSVSC